MLLNQISENSSKILDNIGDIIWSLRSDKENILSIEGRIKNFVSELLGNSDIAYEISIDGNLDENVHNIVARKNLILIVKEAVNNVVKYSKATHVKVGVKITHPDLIIEIIDNGVGMDLEKIKNTGNGLSNMRKRTQELDGIFAINTRPGMGTNILAKIPIVKIRDKVI